MAIGADGAEKNRVDVNLQYTGSVDIRREIIEAVRQGPALVEVLPARLTLGPLLQDESM